MLNKIIIMGRLTRDPELRFTSKQLPVASFAVAVDREYSGKGEEKITDFFDCTAWRHTAEFASKYLHKGYMVAVEGRLEFHDWTDNAGVKRRKAEINVANIYIGNSGKAQGGNYTGNGGYSGNGNYGNYGSYGGSYSNYGNNGYGGYGSYSGNTGGNTPAGTAQEFTELSAPEADLPWADVDSPQTPA